MCKVLICANQKGGVAKSTSVVNLGIGLARKGKRVLGAAALTYVAAAAAAILQLLRLIMLFGRKRG